MGLESGGEGGAGSYLFLGEGTSLRPYVCTPYLPLLVHSRLGDKAQRPLHSGCFETFFFFLPLSELPLAEPTAGRLEGVQSQACKIQPQLYTRFPQTTKICGGVYPTLAPERRWLHCGLVGQRTSEVRLSSGAEESSTPGQNWIFPQLP